MKVEIEVKDEAEAKAIAAAFDDPPTRAFVLVVGLLLPLDDGARKRVLRFVGDTIQEDSL